ncbi:receptor-like protein kinase [Musa troglodytarum]|uniref:Receptor-like protein kinase n=1 Tax=Musa troglodytarum TaxID=320322 RepID=A0A9E7FL68_9LILI|nr:receptor-like protein kinase [Musa troglodytarum]
MALFFFLLLPSLLPVLHAQQPYEGILTTDCKTQYNSSSLLGYFCNSRPNCQAFLTFHSQPPYNSVVSISSLLSSHPSELSQANSVSPTATFPTGTKVVVPVNCSCSGAYYQLNSSYLVQPRDTALVVANNTYQALSTCQSIMNQSLDGTDRMFPGVEITVPLRCACATSKQTSNGVKYLLSYLVDLGDTIFGISSRFGVDRKSIEEANEISDTNTIYPFTTLLIPLQSQPNTSQLAAPPPPPQSPPAAPPHAGNSSSHAGLYAGVGVAAGALALAALVAIYCVAAKAKKKKVGEALPPSDSITYRKAYGKSSDVESYEKEASEDITSMISEIGHALRVYKFEELQLATENFSYECLVEGSVYRGMFNGDAAAVKVINGDVSKEVEVLKKINHFNLIKLSGVSFNQGQWFLVYEYADNGPLSHWIFDTSGSKVLSWVQRMQIAVDVANGVSYLHSYTEPAYVHKDIRSSNILLDQTMRAKVANFGMARASEGRDGEFVLTRHIVGTKGYLAPEYLEHGLVSPELDVYAFGVVMMEMITGRDGSETQRRDQFSWNVLATMVSEGGGGGGRDATETLGSFMDPLLAGKYPSDLALEMVRLIESCLRRDAGSRPSMEKVALSLSRMHSMSLIWEQSPAY